MVWIKSLRCLCTPVDDDGPMLHVLYRDVPRGRGKVPMWLFDAMLRAGVTLSASPAQHGKQHPTDNSMLSKRAWLAVAVAVVSLVWLSGWADSHAGKEVSCWHLIFRLL